MYSPLSDTELHTDTSSKGFGKFHPVAYYLKSTSEVELETSAVIYALSRFRIFLDGRRFTIVTDCNSLTFTRWLTRTGSIVCSWWDGGQYN